VHEHLTNLERKGYIRRSYNESRAIEVMPPRGTTRKASTGAMGRRAVGLLPDAYFELVRATMAMPGWRLAMSSHLNLAMASGRPRPENLLTDDELRSIEVPVRLILGDGDVYGPPEIGHRAAALMPDAHVDVLAAGHAPFCDEPETCAALIREAS
jgi:pimeloyl-ACP methyl ester carboxylesterase